MQLPNPFAGSSSVKPAVRTEEFKSTINVGPGLPKAHSVDYGHFSATSNQSKSYGHGGFVRNFASLQNLPFSCERCNRSFKSQDLLSAHVSEHVTCGIDGCTFTAHPKIIQNHIQMQHETGLAAQIMRLNTPEEIEKWREERKRKFPTAANMARRQEELEEKKLRGEVLSVSNDRFNRKRSNARGRGRGRGRGGSRGDTRKPRSVEHPSGTTKPPVAPATAKPVPVPKSLTAPSVKTNGALEKKVLSDGEVDSEEETEASNDSLRDQGKSANALASLMGAYASDSDSETEETPAKKPALMDEAVDEPKVAAVEDKEAPAPDRGRRPKKSKPPRAAPGPKTTMRPIRLTLLQKLLEDEIVHERNVILQCVHYIYERDFFGVGRLEDAPVPRPPM